MNNPVLHVSDLNVHYGASHALQGVTLDIQGGIHAILGRNGMGKTTLINHILTDTKHKKKIAIIENEFGEVDLYIT